LTYSGFVASGTTRRRENQEPEIDLHGPLLRLALLSPKSGAASAALQNARRGNEQITCIDLLKDINRIRDERGTIGSRFSNRQLGFSDKEVK
jgi:hypothetical protein